MAKLTAEQKQIIRSEMKGLGGAEAASKAKTIVENFKHLFDMEIDITRIYHYSRDVRQKRNRRADKGKLRTASDEVMHQLAWFTVHGDYSAPHAIETWAANHDGEIPCSETTLNRWLKQNGLSRRLAKKDLRIHLPWQGAYPNHVHEVDATVAQQFYIDDDGSIGFEPTDKHKRPGDVPQFYKNKHGNRKQRLILFSLVDSNSRVTYARFAYSTNTYNWMNFLFHAWKIKEDLSGFPFHGLPVILYSDKDPATDSAKRFQRAMGLLGVKFLHHTPGEPQAKGKVENRFKFLQEMEKATLFKKWQSLNEANAALMDYLYFVNGRKHRGVKNEVPFVRWLRITKQQLRFAPDDEIFRQLHMQSTWRKVSSRLTVQLQGQEWDLPKRRPFINLVGQSVEIMMHPNEQDQIYIVVDDQEYPVEYNAPGMRSVGRYEAPPLPDALVKRQEIEAQSMPKTETGADYRLTGFYKERHRKNYLPREGQEFEQERVSELRTGGVVRNRTWFITQLHREFLLYGEPSPHQLAYIDSIIKPNEEKPEEELRQTIARLITDPSPLQLRAAQGG